MKATQISDNFTNWVNGTLCQFAKERPDVRMAYVLVWHTDKPSIKMTVTAYEDDLLIIPSASIVDLDVIRKIYGLERNKEETP